MAIAKIIKIKKPVIIKRLIEFKKGDRLEANAKRYSDLPDYRLICKLAQKYRGNAAKYGVPLDEVIIEGCKAYINSQDKFDSSRGFKYQTYLCRIADHEMMRYLQSKSRVPRGSQQLYNNLEKAYKVYLKIKSGINVDTTKLSKGVQEELTKLNTDKGVENLIRRLNIWRERVRTERLISLDEPIGKDEYGYSITRRSTIKSGLPSPEEVLLTNERKRLIYTALDKLDPKLKVVIIGRFLTEPPKTLEEISIELSLTKERIRQIQNKAIKELKRILPRLTNRKGLF